MESKDEITSQTKPLYQIIVPSSRKGKNLVAVFITFAFHTVEKSQFRALGHCDLKNHLVSHTGEKPLRFMPSLGNNALFLIISFHSSRYWGLHWGWGGSAREGGGRCWMRERATQIQLVFQFLRVFEGMSENCCVHVLKSAKISFWYRRMFVILLNHCNL